MASRFSSKNYFKKIYTPELIVELYKRHEVTALFEITEQTPRKNVLNILNDFHNSLSPEQKITIEEEFRAIYEVFTPHSDYIISLILKERGLSSVTTIECKSSLDLVLYYYLFNKEDIFDDLTFFTRFYKKAGYMLYEAKEVEVNDVLFATTEIAKEYKRILEKEDRIIETEYDAKSLQGYIYFIMTAKDIVSKREDTVRVVYMGGQKEIIVSHTGGAYEKKLLLDTFLRIACADGYLERVESYSLTSFMKEEYTFVTPSPSLLMSWKAKNITLSFGSDTQRHKMKYSLPSKTEGVHLHPLFALYKELGIYDKLPSLTIDSITLSFYCIDQKNKEKTVHIPVTLSSNKTSLCPLYFYHAHIREIFKTSNIFQGFIEQAKKEKEAVTKKWEV
ncbi:MAG: hypothetical protein RLZZ308_255 [Candidatus Parcubacteria bacterium]|jgi:hypothetical protein